MSLTNEALDSSNTRMPFVHPGPLVVRWRQFIMLEVVSGKKTFLSHKCRDYNSHFTYLQPPDRATFDLRVVGSARRQCIHKVLCCYNTRTSLIRFKS